MRQSLSALALILCTLACGGRDQGGWSDAGYQPRLSLDGECNLDKAFLVRSEVPGLDAKIFANMSQSDGYPALTPDELTVVFYRYFTGVGAERDVTPGLFMAGRAARDEPFVDARRVLPATEEFSTATARSLSSDGLRLFFVLDNELRLARRESLDAAWAVDAARFTGLTRADGVAGLVVSGDQETIYFHFIHDVDKGIFRRTWSGAQWENEERVLSSGGRPVATNTSGTTLAFALADALKDMPAGVWFVERNTQGAFGTPVRHPEFGVPASVKGAPGMTEPTWISPNGCRVYHGAGTLAFWQREK